MLSITRIFVLYSKGTPPPRGSASAGRAGDLLSISGEHLDDGYHITFEHVSFTTIKAATTKTTSTT